MPQRASAGKASGRGSPQDESSSASASASVPSGPRPRRAGDDRYVNSTNFRDNCDEEAENLRAQRLQADEARRERAAVNERATAAAARQRANNFMRGLERTDGIIPIPADWGDQGGSRKIYNVL